MLGHNPLMLPDDVTDDDGTYLSRTCLFTLALNGPKTLTSVLKEQNASFEWVVYYLFTLRLFQIFVWPDVKQN